MDDMNTQRMCKCSRSNFTSPLLCAPCPPRQLQYDEFINFASRQNLTECEINKIVSNCNIPQLTTTTAAATTTLNTSIAVNTTKSSSYINSTSISTSTYSDFTSTFTSTPDGTRWPTTVETATSTDEVHIATVVGSILAAVVLILAVVTFFAVKHFYCKPRATKGGGNDTQGAQGTNQDTERGPDKNQQDVKKKQKRTEANSNTPLSTIESGRDNGNGNTGDGAGRHTKPETENYNTKTDRTSDLNQNHQAVTESTNL